MLWFVAELVLEVMSQTFSRCMMTAAPAPCNDILGQHFTETWPESTLEKAPFSATASVKTTIDVFMDTFLQCYDKLSGDPAQCFADDVILLDSEHNDLQSLLQVSEVWPHDSHGPHAGASCCQIQPPTLTFVKTRYGQYSLRRT